tara:strand:+ start:1730 stop:2824 length:1095 start_codon:yes stop_codon:yes gene_type:complete
MKNYYSEGEFLFDDYMHFKSLDVNKLDNIEFTKIVEEYKRDKIDLKFPLYTKKQIFKIYVKKIIPKILIDIFRYCKAKFFLKKTLITYFLYKKKYQNTTIYIAAGSRCAGTWLSEILAMSLKGYLRFHPTEYFGATKGGYFDINLEIAENIKDRLYVICAHTPPRKNNIKIMNKYLKKYIATIRDPRDVVVSIYFHMKKYPCGPTSFWENDNKNNLTLPWKPLSSSVISLSKKEFIDKIIQNLLPGVLGLMEGWVDYSLTNNNVKIIKYEELKLNTLDVVQDILNFFGVEVDNAIINDSITNLNPKNNKNVHINYSSGRVPLDDKNYLLPHSDWEKHLTADQIEIIEERSKNFYHKAGYSARNS